MSLMDEAKRVSTATAPGKIILFGEHAVVYGRPALAVPVHQVMAVCRIEDGWLGQGIEIVAPDLDQHLNLRTAAADEPLALAIRHTLAALQIEADFDLKLSITSTIPIARGLGSGAALSTAIVKALVFYFERELSLQGISDIVFEVEKLYHGTPSGIDNSVVTFAQPIFFQRGLPISRLRVGAPITLVIGDTGVKSQTHKVVGDLRARRAQAEELYEGYFDEMAVIARQARVAIERGHLAGIGKCMVENHALLDQIGVSSAELNILVEAALAAGALGAKLSGAGWGGNMIALTSPAEAEIVSTALQQAGATNTIITRIEPG